jgi:glycosyltransferase involved in cell wall biosynthesis
MRVLLTADAELPVPPPLYGGIERIIDLLVNEYVAAGHEVGLAANAESTSKATTMFPWPAETSVRSWAQWRNADSLRVAVAAFQPEIIHSFSRLMWLAPLALDRCPKLMTYQREPTARTVRWSDRLHRGRLQFTGCSEYICRKGRERGGGTWSAIPNAVDLQTYDFRPTVASDAPLVFLSRIEPIKGCHTAIEIAKRAGRRLLIAGTHSEEGVLGDYWQQIVLPEIGRNGIEYVGPVNDRQKNELLGQAAAMVVPIEWNEPFGIVFIEALACGTPVISCALGALPEIVRDGIDGFLITGAQEGAAAVDRLATLGRTECRKRVEANFSSTIVARQYSGLYEELAEKHR